MYSGIVALLFPAYIVGCLLALSLSWSRRSAALAFSYGYILVTFQFFISGRAAEFGSHTFLYCAYAQEAIGLCAVASKISAGRLVALCSLSLFCLNALACLAFNLGHPIREIYFVGVNAFQTSQILAMILMSPVATRLYNRIHIKRSLPWTHQIAASGQI